MSKTMSMAGDLRILPAEANLSGGQIALVNEDRLTAATYQEALTQYTVGWKDPENLQATIEGLFGPPVPVARRFEFKTTDTKDYFLSDGEADEDVRGVGADFKLVEFAGTNNNAKTHNRGLRTRVDNDEKMDGWQQRAVAVLLQRLLRNELRRGLKLLDTGATNNAQTWTYNSSTNPAPNPDDLIRAQCRESANASGVRPNVLAVGEAAWDIRAAAYAAQNNAGAYRSAGMTPEQLAAYLMLDAVVPVRSRYQSSLTAKTAALGQLAYLYYRGPGLSKDDPSHVKYFYTPAEGGTRYRVYVKDEAKYSEVIVEHYSLLMAASTLGLRKITVS